MHKRLINVTNSLPLLLGQFIHISPGNFLTIVIPFLLHFNFCIDHIDTYRLHLNDVITSYVFGVFNS